MYFTIRLIESTYDMWSDMEREREREEKSTMPLMTWSQKSHTISSVKLYSLRQVNKYRAHTRDGKLSSTFWREEYQKIYVHILKLPQSFKILFHVITNFYYQCIYINIVVFFKIYFITMKCLPLSLLIFCSAKIRSPIIHISTPYFW